MLLSSKLQWPAVPDSGTSNFKRSQCNHTYFNVKLIFTTIECVVEHTEMMIINSFWMNLRPQQLLGICLRDLYASSNLWSVIIYRSSASFTEPFRRHTIVWRTNVPILNSHSSEICRLWPLNSGNSNNHSQQQQPWKFVFIRFTYYEYVYLLTLCFIRHFLHLSFIFPS